MIIKFMKLKKLKKLNNINININKKIYIKMNIILFKII